MMEKVMPECLERVCVKAEHEQKQACVGEESSCSNVCVKDEPSSADEGARGVSEAAAAALYADHVVKDELVLGPALVQPRRKLSTVQEDEPPCSDVCVKEEPSSEVERARGVSSAAAAAALYADHVVKDELVLGPALVQPRRELSTVQEDEPSCSDVCVKEEPSLEVERARGVSSAAAAAALYADHVVKDELVLGPALVQPRRELSTMQGQTQQKKHHGSRKHTVEKSYKCDQCSYACVSKRDFKVHERTHNGEKPYKCNHCSYACARRSSLKGHGRTHTGEKPYKCNQCSYASAQRGSLLCHVKTHTGEKPYKCNHCSYDCAGRTILKVHERTHTGEKPYKCNQCSYASAQQSSLSCHLKTHTGEKPYKCDQCSYASARRKDLQVHIRTHTGEKPYKCGQCSYATTRKSLLKVHERAHTGEKPY